MSSAARTSSTKDTMVGFAVIAAIIFGFAQCGSDEELSTTSSQLAPIAASQAPAATTEPDPNPAPWRAVSPAATTAMPGEQATVTLTDEVPPEPEPVPNTLDEGGSGGGAAYYPNCSAARSAGAAPLYAGGAGYSSKLDRDGDGVACES